MDDPDGLFDICIICALPEEARAFLEVMQTSFGGILEEHISPRYGYSSRSTTLKNSKDESLSLHVSWLPRYGPQEMTLHLERLLCSIVKRIVVQR